MSDETELTFSGLFDALAELEGQDVSVAIRAQHAGGSGGFLVGRLAGARMMTHTDRSPDGDDSRGIAKFEVGGGGFFTIDAALFRGAAHILDGTLIFNIDGTCMQVDSPPLVAVGAGETADE